MAEGLSLNIDTLKAKVDEIAEVDAQLDAASDSATAGKRAIANQLVKDNEEVIVSLVDQITSFLAGQDDSVIAGVYTGVNRELKRQYDDQVSKHLENLAETNPVEQVTLSPEALAELTENRKKLNEQYKALSTLLDSFGIDISSVPVPKKRTGARGKRGKRAMSMFQFSWNGEELSAAENSLTLIAKRAGSFDDITVTDDEGNTKKVTPAKALRDFLGEQGIDQSDPPAEWEVTLPSGDTLSAVRFASDTDEDEDDGDEEVTETE